MSEQAESVSNTNKGKKFEWKEEQEIILKGWADKALCFKTMHDKAFKKFWCLNAWFTIPVIIFSTITGTGNFAQGSFPESIAASLIIIMGGINLLSGIISTIGQYIGVAQTMEAHRFMAVSWDKFSRKIAIELSKSRKDRVNARDFIKICQEEYDRLIESSPSFSSDIIRWFNNMIDTGEYDEQMNDCELFCHEKCCFPFGCKLCICRAKLPFMKTDKQKKKEASRTQLAEMWKTMELPEVLGRIKPVTIAEISESSDDEEIEVVIQHNNEDIEEEVKEEINEYAI